jgi:3-methyladenine DNA glycosylase/8-oxoguanine DNA glycosylase
MKTGEISLKLISLHLKPPRFPTLFEAVINGIASQQITLTLGIILLNRLATDFGRPVLTCLCQLKGVGRWTAEYVMLRCLGRIHLFPGAVIVLLLPMHSGFVISGLSTL